MHRVSNETGQLIEGLYELHKGANTLVPRGAQTGQARRGALGKGSTS